MYYYNNYYNYIHWKMCGRYDVFFLQSISLSIYLSIYIININLCVYTNEAV